MWEKNVATPYKFYTGSLSLAELYCGLLPGPDCPSVTFNDLKSPSLAAASVTLAMVLTYFFPPNTHYRAAHYIEQLKTELGSLLAVP